MTSPRRNGWFYGWGRENIRWTWDILLCQKTRKNGDKMRWILGTRTQSRCHRKAVSAETSGSVFTLTSFRMEMSFCKNPCVHVNNNSCCLVSKPCLTLWNPMDCSMPGSSLHGILQTRILQGYVLLQGHLPDPGIKPIFPSWQVDSLPLSYQGNTQQ